MAGVMCPNCLGLDGEHSRICPNHKNYTTTLEWPVLPPNAADAWYYTTPAWDPRERTMCRMKQSEWLQLSATTKREAYKQFTGDKCGMGVLVPGVGPDAPTVENEHGAKQSASLHRCDLLPPLALLRVAEVLKHGADKYGPEKWRKIAACDHLNHALTHLLAYMAGDRQDDHPGHALCRLMMWFETVEQSQAQK